MPEQELPVIDKTQEDIDKIVTQRDDLEEELRIYKNAFNTCLALYTRPFLDPVGHYPYLTNQQKEYLFWMLTDVVRPIAFQLADRKPGEPFKQQMMRLSQVSFYAFVESRNILTDQHEVTFQDKTYRTREEGGIVYAVQIKPEVPKSDFHDQPLALLTEAIKLEAIKEMKSQGL